MNKNKIMIYIAGPLGTIDPFSNVGIAIRYANKLRARGYVPHVPHLYALWAAVCPGVPREEWMRLDLAVLARCDLLVRLPGVSPGADQEVDFAVSHNIPIIQALPFIDVDAPAPDAWIESALNGEPRGALEGPVERGTLRHAILVALYDYKMSYVSTQSAPPMRLVDIMRWVALRDYEKPQLSVVAALGSLLAEEDPLIREYSPYNPDPNAPRPERTFWITERGAIFVRNMTRDPP
jgi:hypothetical protein